MSNDAELSLYSLGIPWKGSPKLWNTIPRNLLHSCTIQGNVIDTSGVVLYRLKPIGNIGNGTFGIIDSFSCINSTGEKIVAIKRPKHPSVDLFLEALFQWRTHLRMSKYELGFCIPEVYDIFKFKQTGDIWFSMREYKSNLLSTWCLKHLGKSHTIFGYLILQIALVLEVLQNILNIDHRDLKVNNILIVDSPIEINIVWKEKKQHLRFPFHIVFVDFGHACAKELVDVRRGDGLPPIDLCPKEGRDIFQILVSLWRIQDIRNILESKWGDWIRLRIESAEPHYCLRLAEGAHDLNWMYSVTDNTKFRAPLCTPAAIIRECMSILSLE
jgi:serine/threonine protein kinase